jgi:hypothetical protein
LYRHNNPIFEDDNPVPEPLSPGKKQAWIQHFMESRM